jgi:hypothetical protein
VNGGLIAATAFWLATLAAQALYLRPALRRRIAAHARRRAQLCRRSLAALTRAATLHSYRPRHMRRHP